MSELGGKFPWQNGFWKPSDSQSRLYEVDGDKMGIRFLSLLDYPDIDCEFPSTMAYGSYGRPRDEAKKSTGAHQFNLHIYHSVPTLPKNDIYGVVNDAGDEIVVWGLTNSVEKWTWLSPKELEELKEDRDDFDAPSIPYVTPQPEKPGKVIWVSGPPGAGKSTTCQLMARQNGYAYYEADCMMPIMGLVNPFTDIHVDNPTRASMKNKALKGFPYEDAKTILKTSREMQSIWAGKVVDFGELHRPLLSIACREIVRQKRRLGGTFAVAHAVTSRENRDFCREALKGHDVIFIVLNLTKSCQEKRLEKRQGGGGRTEALKKMYGLYEPAGRDEEKCFNVTISEDTTPGDVVEKVLEIIAKM